MSERETLCKHFTQRRICEPCDLTSQLDDAREQIRDLQIENQNLRTWAHMQTKEEDALKRLKEIIKV